MKLFEGEREELRNHLQPTFDVENDLEYTTQTIKKCVCFCKIFLVLTQKIERGRTKWSMFSQKILTATRLFCKWRWYFRLAKNACLLLEKIPDHFEWIFEGHIQKRKKGLMWEKPALITLSSDYSLSLISFLRDIIIPVWRSYCSPHPLP